MSQKTTLQNDLSDAGFATIRFSPTTDIYSLVECNKTGQDLLQIGAVSSDMSLQQMVAPPVFALLKDMHQKVCESNAATPFNITAEDIPQIAIAGTAFKAGQNSLAIVFNKAAPADHEQIQDIGSEWAKTADVTSDIITILDTNMRIIGANKATYGFTDLSKEELLGTHCYNSFYGFNQPCPECPVVKTLDDHQAHTSTINCEKRGRTISITSSPLFDDDGKLSMMIQISRDITEIITKDHETRQLFKAIEQASDAVVLTDSRGVIQYNNPAFTKATGYLSTDVVGENIRILVSNKHDASFYRDVKRTLISGKAWFGTFINKKKDGTLYSAQSSISPVFDDNNKITAFVAVQRDVSKEISIQKKLQEGMKLEAIGTLASGITHEFNNILSAMIGYAQVVRAHVKGDPPALYAVDHILSSGDRAADLIKQIMIFSRKDESSEPFKPLKIQFVLKGVLKLIRSSLPSTIKLDQQVSTECGPILADASQIHQVIVNLCNNARQAIDDNHGEITVHLSEKEITEHSIPTNLPGMKPGKYAYIIISDNGCGMDAETIKRVYDPFFTTKSKQQGAGLGLSVAHGIIKKHQGNIDITSHPGKGTIVSLYFPVIQAEATETVKPKKLAGGTEHILLVDDEPQITEFLTVVLKRLGYSITAFTDSLLAVQYFRENSEEVDLIITDMTMPNMTGSELAREVLSIRPELPIILATGYSENFDREKALRLGIREFLAKPLKRDVLAHAIRTILDNG